MNDDHINRVCEQLAQSLPAKLHALHEQKMQRRIVSNGAGNPTLPCQICGKKHYGSAFAAKHKYCPACRKALRQGFTAFVTLTNGQGHRHLIAKDLLVNQPKAWSGAVRVVGEEEMDYLVKLVEQAKEGNE